MAVTADVDARPVIDFEHVWKTYPNGTHALRDVTLTVPDGDFVFLVGPSGAGKSSMVRLIIREEQATRGRVVVHGADLGALPRRQLPRFRRSVGLVFQDYKLLPAMTVQENVAFALRVLGQPRWAIQRLTVRALDRVGLDGMGGKYPCELSGGEQQRVAIARALVHHPDLIVADEPTGNLDPATAWEIVQLLLGINAEGATVLMATHNRDIVDQVRRRVVAIDRGRVVRDDLAGTYHEDLAAPAVHVR
jgi:cell division transport system ATP-binding protein